MITDNDLLQIGSKGISLLQIESQIENFKRGFPFLKIQSAASAKRGIKIVSSDENVRFVKIWDDYLKEGATVVKFIPASGAASRMFKDLFSFLDADYSTPNTPAEKSFFSDISNYAFFSELDEICKKLYNADIDELITKGEHKKIVKALLKPDGLNYGSMPKGVLSFHKYDDAVRKPMEEHMVESCLYAKSSDGIVNLHFTVSPEHISLFEEVVSEKKGFYEDRYGVEFVISYSVQKPSTDTIAVDLTNSPFREDGKLVFRPGGHGALIENLNDIDADVIFIKNIDNVVPDRLKEEEAEYKKMIAGVLVETQRKAFDYISLLEKGELEVSQFEEIKSFMTNTLLIDIPNLDLLSRQNVIELFISKLNRPFRVCGMVKNMGEPGGGPFFVVNGDGTTSLQILESSQIDMSDPIVKKFFLEGSHFNPVDIVCGVKDRNGEKFDLLQYVDKNTGFISYKSKNGRELKALELPGLWNGAMSDWNTIFVEVPISTFNPVKTVNDLTREQHQ